MYLIHLRMYGYYNFISCSYVARLPSDFFDTFVRISIGRSGAEPGSAGSSPAMILLYVLPCMKSSSIVSAYYKYLQHHHACSKYRVLANAAFKTNILEGDIIYTVNEYTTDFFLWP